MSAAVAPTPVESWWDANQRDLVGHLDRVRKLLEGASVEPVETVSAPVVIADERYALGRLATAFGLTPFERDVLVLSAGVELDSRFTSLVADLLGIRAPTFGLALAVLPDAHWSAVTPWAPLRRWHLVESTSAGLIDATLRLDERILHYLAGIDELDVRLAGVVRPLSVTSLHPRPSHRAVTRLLSEGFTVVQVTGTDPGGRAEAIAGAAALLDATPWRVRDADLPAQPDERAALGTLAAREWRIGRRLVALEAADEGLADRVVAFAQGAEMPLVVSAREPLPDLAEIAPVVDVPIATVAERVDRWRAVLGSRAAVSDSAVTAAAMQFDLSGERLRQVGWDGQTADGEELWEACRAAARPRMDGLAQRIEAAADWPDLILPAAQLTVLRTIAEQVGHRHRVYEDWGFARRGARGLGISALFVGDPGTGKTMAAEVLARELRLDLYRVDLATVVSKYVGETEKNLRRLFDAAEGSGAVLLFDEADALFGKRSEVRDSHDRYANIEVSYLLQRMETYRGLAILTTNMKQVLDPAFVRRIRFVVRFPFPDADQRAGIWRRAFPVDVPRDSIDPARLAQLDVAGGGIRNIALGAAFLAAARDEPVTMAHIAEAARTEYAKNERPLTQAETRSWA
jgi:ATPase family associated with various cellular activities (AAA)/Winged helix domain, variant